MQRKMNTPNMPATVPNAAAQTPVVYRSLPVAAAAAPVVQTTSPQIIKGPSPAVSKKQQAAGPVEMVNGGSESPNSVVTIPFPPVPVSGLQQGAIWKESVDLNELQRKLKSNCSECELRRTRSSCEFRCKAEAEDGNEECYFTLNLWRVPEGEEGALGKYLIQVDRSAGCPYFFRQVMAKTFDVPVDAKKPLYFRVPELPGCFCDAGRGIRPECIERAISLATSDVFEQRLQGMNVLADLCAAKNPTFVSLFQAANGPARISKLEQDPDCCIRRAAARVLSHCSA